MQVVINIGRGLLLNETDLVNALASGVLKGAALDVFAQEPLPAPSPLWDLPNVLISPHNADMTADFRHQSVRLFCDNCYKFLAGDNLINVVDKSSGY
jgi:phosphoglycerate dehydrogenase-like enzyme